MPYIIHTQYIHLLYTKHTPKGLRFTKGFSPFKASPAIKACKHARDMLPTCQRYAFGLPKICFWVARAMLLAP